VEPARVFKKRVLLGLFIIVAGVCASLPFRKEAPEDGAAASKSAASSTASTASPLVEAPATLTQLPLAPSPYLDDGSRDREPVQAHRAPLASTAEEVVAVPREEPVVLPMLPVSFQVKESSDRIPRLQGERDA
jgi:hypothetical protein